VHQQENGKYQNESPTRKTHRPPPSPTTPPPLTAAATLEQMFSQRDMSLIDFHLCLLYTHTVGALRREQAKQTDSFHCYKALSNHCEEKESFRHCNYLFLYILHWKNVMVINEVVIKIYWVENVH